MLFDLRRETISRFFNKVEKEKLKNALEVIVDYDGEPLNVTLIGTDIMIAFKKPEISKDNAAKLGVTITETSDKGIYYMILPIEQDKKEFIEFLDKLEKQAEEKLAEEKKESLFYVATTINKFFNKSYKEKLKNALKVIVAYEEEPLNASLIGNKIRISL